MEGTPINNQLATDLTNLNQPSPAELVEDFRNEVVKIGMVKERLVQTTNRDVLNQLYGKINDAVNKVLPLKGNQLKHGLVHSLLEALVELVHIVRELASFERSINEPNMTKPKVLELRNEPQQSNNNVLVDMTRPKVLELRNEDKAA